MVLEHPVESIGLRRSVRREEERDREGGDQEQPEPGVPVG
jgi:hypothetical protein